jgi:RNA polymerase sigma-70 factor (ECF subfamily)
MEQRAAMTMQHIDEHVIEACRQGDMEAFRLLFEAYQDKVYSIAFYFFRYDEALAHDTTQQVFLKLMTSIKGFRADSEFTTWLYRLVVNACVDEQRKRSRFLFFGDEFEMKVAGEQSSQERRYERIEIADAVKEAITQLKPKLRLAILLKYVEELSYEEMAVALGCSKGTVASRLNRGHKMLARRLGHLRSELGTGE